MPLDPVTGLPRSILDADARRKRGQALALDAQAESDQRRKRGQALASQYSSWANEQNAAKRKKDLEEVEAASNADVEDEWADKPVGERHDDWLKRLGVRMPERNPMLGRDTLPDRLYGYDPTGPEGLGIQDVSDQRRLLPPVPSGGAASRQAAVENRLTPAMAAALSQGNVTAPTPVSPVAAMYDLGAGNAEQRDLELRRLWGAG